jgi:hypothetical protein
MTRNPQPARGVLAYRGIQLIEAAKAIGYNEQYFGRVLLGVYPASPEFRSRLAVYLGESEDSLFRQVAAK